MTELDIGFLATTAAVDAVSIALSIFSFGLAAPVAAAISYGFHAISAALPTIKLLAEKGNDVSFAEIFSSIGQGLISAFPIKGISSLAKKYSTKLFNKMPKEKAIMWSKLLRTTSKKLDKVNKFIDNISPDKLVSKGMKKLINSNGNQALLRDAQLISRKEAEQQIYGEVRTQTKINSTKNNPNQNSWIKAAHFEEEKFINRNTIIGTLTIFYYLNNDSRLGRRSHAENGNNQLRAIQIPKARYKNDYVSGICRAKSWGSYYMRTWMIGKPGRAAGINTLIFFGGEWRVDKKIKNLITQYRDPAKSLQNHSEKIAKHFIGKTKIGTKLLSFGDAYTKTKGLMGGNIKILNPYLKKGMKKIKQKGIFK